MNAARKTGYIALLDVLGFSELIARESRNEELQHYFDAFEGATQKGVDSVEYVLFSDTIVISTPSHSDDALLELLRACSYAMHYLLRAGLPVRGAISHGTYLRSQTPRGVLIAGSAFIEAYRFEKAQNWVGILVAPSVLRFFPRLKDLCATIPTNLLNSDQKYDFAQRLEWAMKVQPCHTIPWHLNNSVGHDVMDGYAVIPTSPDWGPLAMANGLNSICDYLQNQRLLASDPSAQRKYDAPLEWITDLKLDWEAVALLSSNP
jgi:hypothetical protein